MPDSDAKSESDFLTSAHYYARSHGQPVAITYHYANGDECTITIADTYGITVSVTNRYRPTYAHATT